MLAEVTAIAAVAENGAIGSGGDLPWPPIEEDLRFFKETTTDSPVIMGRVTYESIVESRGSPLSDRLSIVVSTTSKFKGDGVRTVGSPGSALSLALTKFDEAYVVGGESIYRALLPVCTRMLITEVPGRYDGDAFFPDWDDDEWAELSRESIADGVEVAEYERDQDGLYPDSR